MPRPSVTAAGLVALLATGCQWYYNDVPSPDALMHAVPWFDGMIRSPALHPYESALVPRHTVPGTVPVTGGEADWGADWRVGRTASADALANPTAGATTARGDTLYQVFCATCHGQAGAGDGLVGRKLGAPSLLTDRARGFTDGYLYSIVRYGRGVMPRYGDKIHGVTARWEVVNHLRLLQSRAPAPAGGTAP